MVLEGSPSCVLWLDYQQYNMTAAGLLLAGALISLPARVTAGKVLAFTVWSQLLLMFRPLQLLVI